MRILIQIIFILHTIQAIGQPSPPPIGWWREHLPYSSAIDITAGNNRIYCATPYSLFSITPADLDIERLSRVTGLHETGISAISFDEAGEKLMIAYTNSNIDILFRNDIINIPSIKQDNITGNKSIYSIYSLGKNFYLSTGLGIIVIDAERYEVKDSWLIGNGGNQVSVNGLTSDGNYFYAATAEGLKKAPVNVANPADYNNWQVVTTANGLSAGVVKNVLKLADKILVEKNDSLFIQNGNSWNFFYASPLPLINTTVSGNKIILSQRQSNSTASVTVLNADASPDRILVQPGIISFPRKAIVVDNTVWIADQQGGLSNFTASGSQRVIPNSPQGIASGGMTVYNNVFYAAAGEVNEAWEAQANPDGIYVLKNGEWTNINRYHFSGIDSLTDFITIAVDRRDESTWAGSFGGGLLHIGSGPSFEIFKQGFIGAATSDPASYRVSGLSFDGGNNLWVSNFGAAQPLLVRKADGNWQKFSLPINVPGNTLTQILVDDNDYKWIIAAKGNGLICFDHGSSLESTADDRWKKFNVGAGTGNLPDPDVLCIAMDKSGFIWAGTRNGIGVIQCATEIFTATSCDAVWPVVQQGNFAGYLFSGQEVRSIAIDGADRKWIATAKGVFLVSADGQRVIYQFTEANSPLLSDDVKKIAIDGRTGEVFFATGRGICSFRSTATEARQTNDKKLLVFPNPVPPSYTGTIAIRGVAENAIVKITEPDGRLVFQTRALGGQAVWDGKDYRGRKISTGVYLVLVSNDPSVTPGTEKAAAKIVFIGK